MIDKAFVAETAVKPGRGCVFGAATHGVKVGAGVPAGIYPVDTLAPEVEAGRRVTLRLHGPALALAGDDVTAGAWLKLDAEGALVPTGAGPGSEEAIAYALEPAAEGEFFNVFVSRSKITTVA